MFMTPASLLYRLRQPEEVTAWAHFVDLYTPVFHWAKKLGEQDSDCADLVQDVFVILWRKMPEFEYNASRSFHACLKTIFLNRHRSRLQSRGIAIRSAEANGFPGDMATDDFSEQIDDADDTLYLIRRALQLIELEFSPLQQQVFKAYVLEEQLPELVAKTMGISPGTVYSIKAKILSRLHQELQQILD